MEIVMTSLKDTPLLETQGDIDHNTCEAIEAALTQALDSGARVVLIDLGEVSYIDSGGLSVLFSAARRLRPDGWLGVINPNPNIRRLLELVGLMIDPSFRVFDAREQAEAAVPAE
jgi:anti-anti-sigma factor